MSKIEQPVNGHPILDPFTWLVNIIVQPRTGEGSSPSNGEHFQANLDEIRSKLVERIDVANRLDVTESNKVLDARQAGVLVELINEMTSLVWQVQVEDEKATPTEGRFIVADGATGDWTGHEGEIVEWDGEWQFTAPQNGWAIYLEERGELWAYHDEWRVMANLGKIRDYLLQTEQARDDVLLDSGYQAVAGDLTGSNNIGTVAGSIGNVNTVGGNIGNVNKVGAIDSKVTKVANIDTNVTKVANIDTNVTKVANIDTNVTKVANIDSDVTKVADIDGAVSNVSSIKQDVSDVAGIKTAVTDVANIKADVSGVADIKVAVSGVNANKTNINAVAGNKNNIDKVANINNDVTKVANIDTNVSAVALIDDDVSDVALIKQDVTDVAGIKVEVEDVADIKNTIVAVDANKTNINAVHANKNNIDAVAGNKTNIDAVKNNESNINTVAGAKTNIDKVATDITNVNNVGGNIGNVNAVAGNATNINGVHGNKTNIDKVANNQTNINALAPHAQAIEDLGERTEELDLVAEALGDIESLEKTANKLTTADGWNTPTDEQYASALLVKGSIDEAVLSADVLRKADWGTPCFVKNSPTTASVKAGTRVAVGSMVVSFDSNTAITMPPLTAGEDYSIWVSPNGTIQAIHDPYESPASPPVSGAVKIGGFHYGLIPSGESPTGNKKEADMVKIRGINEHSFWDLKFRWNNGQPRGMVYYAGVWVDIYLLNAEHIEYGSSRAGQWIAGGATFNGRAIPKIPLAYGGNGSTNYGKLTWFIAGEIAHSHNKKLIPYQTFPNLAYGVSEGKSSSKDGYEVTVGKIEHYPHLTSCCGMEQATGVQYVWGADLTGERGSGWRDDADGRGQIYGTDNSPIAVLMSGHRGDGAYAGSRGSHWNSRVWITDGRVGARCAGDHLQLV